MTLEALWRDRPDSIDYDAARAEKVAKIRDYIAGHLRDGIDADTFARLIMVTAEESGRIDGDEISGEIPASYTRTGNPNSFTI